MVLKAVFLDLDDTLVATSVHDVRAFAAVTALASERTRSSGPVDQDKLLADFKAEFKRVPWDPDYKVEVTEWRAGLWAQALDKQNIPDAASLGAELQAGAIKCHPHLTTYYYESTHTRATAIEDEEEAEEKRKTIPFSVFFRLVCFLVF